MKFTSPYPFELSEKAKPVPINAAQNQGYGFVLAADDSIILTAKLRRTFGPIRLISATARRKRIPICATKQLSQNPMLSKQICILDEPQHVTAQQVMC
jgi:hypothetical protein